MILKKVSFQSLADIDVLWSQILWQTLTSAHLYQVSSYTANCMPVNWPRMYI